MKDGIATTAACNKGLSGSVIGIEDVWPNPKGIAICKWELQGQIQLHKLALLAEWRLTGVNMCPSKQVLEIQKGPQSHHS